MALGRTWSVALFGIDGVVVETVASLGARPTPTGLPDTVLAEAKERVRAAVRNSQLAWPSDLVTVELSTGALPTGGCGSDVALACAVLDAAGLVPSDRLADTVLIGELGLDGRIRPVRGVLPGLLAARHAGLRRAVVPASSLPEAALVSGMQVRGADTLQDVVAWLRGHDDRLAEPGRPPLADEPAISDLSGVRGQPEASHALEVAAAGGHHMLLVGPAGTGRTMLAQRLPGLLPPLTHEQALEVTAIRSIAGALSPESPMITRPPFVAPHHSTSLPALVGGGVGPAKPGAISRAHHGVLFLDEAAEVGPSKLESLRTALDDGEIRLARRDGIARYPARFQLVLASAWCPYQRPESDCSCSPHAKRRYLARLTGPLLDQIDLRVRLRPAPPAGADAVPDSTAVVRQRVQQARDRAARRWAAHHATTNAAVPATMLRREPFLTRPVLRLLDNALAAGTVSRRGADLALRVAWTLADLAGLEQPGPDEIREALTYRDRRPERTGHIEDTSPF